MITLFRTMVKASIRQSPRLLSKVAIPLKTPATLDERGIRSSLPSVRYSEISAARPSWVSVFFAWFLCYHPAFAQVCSTPSYPTAIAGQSKLLVAVDNLQTTLSTIQLFSDHSALVVSGTGWLPNMIATVGTEQELVTAVSGNTLTVTRGYAGTSPVQHPAKTVVQNLIDSCYNNIKTAEITAIETALGVNLSNVVGAEPYVTAAITPSPQYILLGVHGQGLNAVGLCYAGPPINIAGKLVASGVAVVCKVTPDGHGNLVFEWYSNDVGSLKVIAGGRGPAGPPGPALVASGPTVLPATGSPMTITVAQHHQGTNPAVDCWAGSVVANSVTGNKVFCQATLDASGNGTLVITYAEPVGSLRIASDGSSTIPLPGAFAATGSPQTISASSHGKGLAPLATCKTAGLSSGIATGGVAFCDWSTDGVGNITITYAPGVVGSVQVQ